jgi:hypothetical protein
MSLFEMAATACSAAKSAFCAFRICAGCRDRLEGRMIGRGSRDKHFFDITGKP